MASAWTEVPAIFKRQGNTEFQAADALDDSALILAEAKKFRAELIAGRSIALLRLFDFLLSRSDDERAPKEIEIAVAISERNTAVNGSQDSAARAYVHRLRRRLDAFYAGKPGPRLTLLKGEYRIVLSHETASPDIGSPVERARTRGNRKRLRILLGFTFPLIPAMLIAIWAVLSRSPTPPLPDAGKTSFWRTVAGNGEPALVVVGDYYLLAESENRRDVKKLILAPDIQSRDELDAYLLKRPEAFYQLYDLDLHYTPLAAAKAVGEILPLVTALQLKKLDLKPSSRLTPDDVKSRNIIYIGSLGRLGLLGKNLARLSNFKIGPDGKELTDGSSGKRYARKKEDAGDHAPQLGYGYIASLPEPSGGHLLIVSALSEDSLAQIADLVTNKQQLDIASEQAGNSDAFEALYEIKTAGSTEPAVSMVAAHSLNARK